MALYIALQRKEHSECAE